MSNSKIVIPILQADVGPRTDTAVNEVSMRSNDVHSQRICHAPTIILANPHMPCVMSSLHEMVMSQYQREIGYHTSHIHTASAACHCGHHQSTGLGCDLRMGEGHTAHRVPPTVSSPYVTRCNQQQQHPEAHHPNMIPPGSAQQGPETLRVGPVITHRIGHDRTGSDGQYSRVDQANPCERATHHGDGCHSVEVSAHSQEYRAPGMGIHPRADVTHDKAQGGCTTSNSVPMSRRRRRNRKNNRRRRAEGRGKLTHQSPGDHGQGQTSPIDRSQTKGQGYVPCCAGVVGGSGLNRSNSGQHSGSAHMDQQSMPTCHMQEQRWATNGEAQVQMHMCTASNVGCGQQATPSGHLCRGVYNTSNTLDTVSHNHEPRREDGARHNPFSYPYTMSMPRPSFPEAHTPSHGARHGANDSIHGTRHTSHIGNDRKKRASGVDMPQQWTKS